MTIATESRLGLPIPALVELLDAKQRSAFVIRSCRAMIDVADALRSAGDGSGANEMLKSVLPLLLREFYLRYSPKKESTERAPGELLQLMRTKHRISAEQMEELRTASAGLGPWGGGPKSTQRLLRAARLLLSLAADAEPEPDMGIPISAEFPEKSPTSEFRGRPGCPDTGIPVSANAVMPAAQSVSGEPAAASPPKDQRTDIQAAVDAIKSGLAMLIGLLQKEAKR